MAAAAMKEPPSRWAWMVPRTNGYSGSGVAAGTGRQDHHRVAQAQIPEAPHAVRVRLRPAEHDRVTVVLPSAPREGIGAARDEVPFHEVTLPVPELHGAAGRREALDGVEV